MSVRVLVADDQEIVRAGLTMILNAQPDIEVVAEAANGQRAVELAQRLRPDVCLFDVRMPGVDGIEATRRLAAPSITARLLRAFAHSGPAAPPARPAEVLTDREEQVLAAVAIGRTNSEIASELYITLSTVKTHIASLMGKLGARNRVEIAMWAYENNRAGR
jgi:DNA-binding NarL/FixJ family response regulator